MFELHADLVRDTVEVTRFPLCRVQLLNDRTYPWLVLVPAKPGLKDFHDVAMEDKATLMEEIDRASKGLVALHSPDKINVAALGNMTPQLHIHVIARFTGDAAWPKPVWGVVPAEKYSDTELEETLAKLRGVLGG
jgi:diadenosine tetraphosphate (Ap4A) HIT family hydrolase